jgi:drug/metabolite transporter (DMT)-like permease
MTSSQDYLKLHFIVFLWGFSAILGKLISIPFVELVFFRAIFAVAGLGIVMFFKKESFRVAPRDFLILIAIGSVVAVHWISFFGSGRIANVSVSLVGFATNTLWTAILEPMFNRTRIKKYEVFLGLMVLAGLYIIFSFDFQYKLGLMLGIAAGLTSAVFSIFNSRMVRRVSPYAISFYEMIGVFLSITVFLPIYRVYFAPDQQLSLAPSWLDFVWIALLAGGCSVYAYTVAVELMKRISVFVIQLCLNLEPIYGILMALLLTWVGNEFPQSGLHDIFGDREKMNASFYIGTLVIMCAVFSYPMIRKRFDKTVLID